LAWEKSGDRNTARWRHYFGRYREGGVSSCHGKETNPSEKEVRREKTNLTTTGTPGRGILVNGKGEGRKKHGTLAKKVFE